MPIQSAKERLFSLSGILLCGLIILLAISGLTLIERNHLERKVEFSEFERLRKLSLALNLDSEYFENSLEYILEAYMRASIDAQLVAFTQGANSEKDFLSYRFNQVSPAFPFLKRVHVINTQGQELLRLVQNSQGELDTKPEKNPDKIYHQKLLSFSQNLKRGKLGLERLESNSQTLGPAYISGYFISAIYRDDQFIGYMIFRTDIDELTGWALRHYHDLDLDFEYYVYNQTGELLFRERPSNNQELVSTNLAEKNLSQLKPELWQQLTSQADGSTRSKDYLYRFRWLKLPQDLDQLSGKNQLLFLARAERGLDKHRNEDVINFQRWLLALKILTIILTLPGVFLIMLWRNTERLQGLAAAAMRSMSPLLIIDDRGWIIDMNNSYCERRSLPREQLLKEKTPLFDGDIGTARFEELKSAGTWTGEYIFTDAGFENTELLSISLMRKKAGRSYYICSFVDISEQKQLQEELSRLSMTDSLTQIANRRAFEVQANRLITQSQRHPDRNFCLLLIDIDHFKKVNDLYGHDVGDQVLINFAENLTEKLRGTDLFARLGGEEFGILLTDTELANAQQVAERIRVWIIDDSAPVDITCSLGLVQYRNGASWADTYKRADEALYTAKAGGRNRVETAQ